MPKTKGQKSELLANYEAIVDSSNFAVVVTKNVPAQVLVDLRKELASVNAKFVVIKNNVFKRAMAKEANAPEDLVFEGPLAVLEGGDDLVTALKKLEGATTKAKAALALSGVEDADVAKYVPFSFKMGVVSHSYLEGADVIRLSNLPDRDTLLAQFVGTLAAPISGMMNAMNGVSRNLVYALSDLKEKKANAS
jgi:large subunit ribosomal protein L10